MKWVTVITGGSSPERHVAFAGAAQVVHALRTRGFRVSVIDTVEGLLTRKQEESLLVGAVGLHPPSVEELQILQRRDLGSRLVQIPDVSSADLVFLVLHGRQGEGGQLQALLELEGIDFTGSGSLGSTLAMDKDIAKQLFCAAGIPTPKWLMWPAQHDSVSPLLYPLVVKPSKVGSTVGLTVCRALAEIREAVSLALQYDDEVLLEEFIEGREFTVGVLDGQALAVGEIIPNHEIFDYECKYTPGMTREIFPAEIPEYLSARMQELALRTHESLKLRDFSRVDFKLSSDGLPYCLEVNTLPGLTSTSLLPQSAAAAGISFEELCVRMCDLVLRRKKTKE